MVQRVALYARVSTADQSCQRQVAELTAYAERSNFEVVAVAEETASGTKNDRAERDRVMILARKRQIDMVLVSELSYWNSHNRVAAEILGAV